MGCRQRALEQIAFADRIVLNKTDLVSDESELNGLHRRIREINALAEIQRATKRKCRWIFRSGLAALIWRKCKKPSWEKMNNTVTAIRTMTMNTITVTPTMLWSNPARLSATTLRTHTRIPAAAILGHSHAALVESGEVICNDPTHSHSHGHSHTHHDDAVGSVSLVLDGDVDLDKINDWLGVLLNDRWETLFRMKGVLSIEGCDERATSSKASTRCLKACRTDRGRKVKQGVRNLCSSGKI